MIFWLIFCLFKSILFDKCLRPPKVLFKRFIQEDYFKKSKNLSPKSVLWLTIVRIWLIFRFNFSNYLSRSIFKVCDLVYLLTKNIPDRKMVSEFAGQSLLLVTLGLLFIDLVMHSGMVICHAQHSPAISDPLINPNQLTRINHDLENQKPNFTLWTRDNKP